MACRVNFTFASVLPCVRHILSQVNAGYGSTDDTSCPEKTEHTYTPNLQEVGCGYMDWIGLAQDTDRWRTLVSVVINLRVP